MTAISSTSLQNDSIARLFAHENLEMNIVTPNPYKCSGKMSEDCWNFDFSEELSKSTILSMNSQSHMAYLRSGSTIQKCRSYDKAFISYRSYCMAHITCIVRFNLLQHRFGPFEVNIFFTKSNLAMKSVSINAVVIVLLKLLSLAKRQPMTSPVVKKVILV